MNMFGIPQSGQVGTKSINQEGRKGQQQQIGQTMFGINFVFLIKLRPTKIQLARTSSGLELGFRGQMVHLLFSDRGKEVFNVVAVVPAIFNQVGQSLPRLLIYAVCGVAYDVRLLNADLQLSH